MTRKILILCLMLSTYMYSASDNSIKQSIAILDSNVGEMKVEMILLKDNKWKLSSYLDGGRIVQREEIEYFYIENNFIRPIEYNFFQKILFRKYNASAIFDWEKNEASYVEKKEKGSVAIEEKVLGPSSAQLQLRLDFRELDLNNIPELLNYKVFWRGSVKERIFDIHKDIEIIETPIGNYPTYKVSRRFESGDTRSQVFWLAPDLDFSVIKIFNNDGRREVEIVMKSLEEID